MTRRRARRWLAAVPTIVALLGIVLVLSGGAGMDPSELVRPLRELSTAWTALAGAAVLVQIALLAARLWTLFPAPTQPSLGRVVHGFFVGHLLNNVVRRSGDVFKVLWLADARLTRAEVTGVVVIDKLVELAVLGALLAVVGIGALATGIPTTPILVVAVAIAAVMVAVFGCRRRSTIALHALAGTRAILEPRRAALAAILALSSWSAELLALHCLAAALGHDLGFADAVRAIVAMNLGVAIPLTAANIGTFEAAIAYALHAAGLPFADAIAIGATYHAIQILAISVWASASTLVSRTLCNPLPPEVL